MQLKLGSLSRMIANRSLTTVVKTLASASVMALFGLAFLGSEPGVSPDAIKARHWNLQEGRVQEDPGQTAQAHKAAARPHTLAAANASATPAYTAQSSEPILKFSGNATVIQNPSGPGGSDLTVALRRESDCSISEYFVTEIGNSTQQAGTLAKPTAPNYQEFLHTVSGLPTTAGTYPKGCKDQELGLPARPAAYFGLTKGGSGITGAFVDYNNNLWVGSMNLTTGVYSDINLLSSTAAGLLAADVDGDGLPDLLVQNFLSSTSTPIVVYHNNGNGTFTKGASYLSNQEIVGFTVDDVNGDGKADIVATTYTSVIVLPGTGAGTFGNAITTAIPSAAYVATGDFNGDLKKDLVLSTGAVLLGDGTGHFTAAKSSITNTGTPVVGDWNNDGKEDVAMLTIGEPGTLTIYLGKGDGTFTQGLSYQVASNLGYASAADLDGDGNLDIVLGESNGGIYGPDYNSSLIQVVMGRGDGTFAGAEAYQDNNSPHSDGGSFVAADFHGKGFIDLLTSSLTGLNMLTGNGQGTFVTTPAIATESQAGALHAADMNADGKADAIYAGSDSEGNPTINVALGKGAGEFDSATATSLPTSPTPGALVITIADFTGDGKLDVVASAGTEAYLLVNDGEGKLGSPTLIATEANPILSAASADLNADKKADLVLAEGTIFDGTKPSTVVLLGNGNGTFKTGVNYSGNYIPVGVAVADMNKDGIADLVVAGVTNDYFAASLYVLPGKGDGTFGSANATTLNYAGVTGLAVADFNGDGDLDVVVTSCCGATATSIAFGNGTGSFPSIYDLELGTSSTAVMAIDVNQDKKPDLLIQAQTSPGSVAVMLNEYGSAMTTPTPTTTKLSASATSVAAGTKVTFTATVEAGSGTAIPTGSVVFSVDGGAGTTVALNTSGEAVFSDGALAVGAHAIKASYSGNASFAASTASLTETVTGKTAATPVFSPAVGTYATAQNVTLTDATSGAAIYYTLNGTTPSASSTKYIAPLKVASTETFQAIAIASGYANSAIVKGTYTITAATPTLSVAPASLTFASLTEGSTSPAQTVTLKNTGTVAVTLGATTFTGTNTKSFLVTSKTCSTSLAAGASCTLSIECKPAVLGALSASLSIADNATGSPQTVALKGTATAASTPTLAVSPTALSFASLAEGATSNAQVITLKNAGKAAVTLGSATVAGTNPKSFLIASQNCGTSLAAGASCTISMECKPAVTGALSATLSILDNAAGSPQVVTLKGTATAVTVTATVAISPTTLAFAATAEGKATAAQVVTVKNTGKIALTLSTASFKGTNPRSFVISAKTCSGTLAPGASCTLSIECDPAVIGALSASLEVVDNASGSPQMVTLKGTSTAP